MSVLTLVRHGQASFFSANYDELSPRGKTQSIQLGEYWSRHGLIFDAVYTGPRARQMDTAEHVGHVMTRAGLPWPEPSVLRDLDEYDLGGIMLRLAPALKKQSPEFASLYDRYYGGENDPLRVRHFQRMFEYLLQTWQDPEKSAVVVDVENWPSFSERVGRGLGKLTEAQGERRRVVAFTSGGFIGAAVHRILDAPARTALELSWRHRNAAFTELVFTKGRVSLDTFNTSPHLQSADLLTYR